MGSTGIKLCIMMDTPVSPAERIPFGTINAFKLNTQKKDPIVIMIMSYKVFRLKQAFRLNFCSSLRQADPFCPAAHISYGIYSLFSIS